MMYNLREFIERLHQGGVSVTGGDSGGGHTVVQAFHSGILATVTFGGDGQFLAGCFGRTGGNITTMPTFVDSPEAVVDALNLPDSE